MKRNESKVFGANSALLKIQSELDSERVIKFGTLIDKKKYKSMTQLANIILDFLGQKEQPTVGSLFKKFELLRVKMISVNASYISSELLSKHQAELQEIAECFTEEKSPREFKKTWKYWTLWSWASKFIEVAQLTIGLNGNKSLMWELEEKIE